MRLGNPGQRERLHAVRVNVCGIQAGTPVLGVWLNHTTTQPTSEFRKQSVTAGLHTEPGRSSRAVVVGFWPCSHRRKYRHFGGSGAATGNISRWSHSVTSAGYLTRAREWRGCMCRDRRVQSFVWSIAIQLLNMPVSCTETTNRFGRQADVYNIDHRKGESWRGMQAKSV